MTPLYSLVIIQQMTITPDYCNNLHIQFTPGWATVLLH